MLPTYTVLLAHAVLLAQTVLVAHTVLLAHTELLAHIVSLAHTELLAHTVLLAQTVSTRRDILSCGADGRGRFHVALLHSPGSVFILHWAEDFSQYSMLKYSKTLFVPVCYCPSLTSVGHCTSY